MFGIEDPTVFEKFEQAELEHPTPRKEIDGRVIYLSRELDIPKILGPPVLCDFGSAAWGEERHEEDVQPDVYRSPEVILKVPWSYEIDIWNAGCMVGNNEAQCRFYLVCQPMTDVKVQVWDLFEGGHMFYGTDPELNVYRSRAHLAEIIALLGPPPREFVARGLLRSKFFSEQGQSSVFLPRPVLT